MGPTSACISLTVGDRSVIFFLLDRSRLDIITLTLKVKVKVMPRLRVCVNNQCTYQYVLSHARVYVNLVHGNVIYKQVDDKLKCMYLCLVQCPC